MAWTLSHALFSLSRPSTTATFLLLQPSSVEKTLISQAYFFIYFNLASGGVASTIALVTIGFLLIETQSLAQTVNGKNCCSTCLGDGLSPYFLQVRTFLSIYSILYRTIYTIFGPLSFIFDKLNGSFLYIHSCLHLARATVAS